MDYRESHADDNHENVCWMAEVPFVSTLDRLSPEPVSFMDDQSHRPSLKDLLTLCIFLHMYIHRTMG